MKLYCCLFLVKIFLQLHVIHSTFFIQNLLFPVHTPTDIHVSPVAQALAAQLLQVCQLEQGLVVSSHQDIISLNKQWLLLPVVPEKHLFFDGRNQAPEEAFWALKTQDWRRNSCVQFGPFTLCLGFLCHFSNLPSFLGHLPVLEEREPQQSASSTTSMGHRPRAAALALPRGISKYTGNSFGFRGSLIVPNPLSNLSKLQRALLGATAQRRSHPTAEFVLKNMWWNPMDHYQCRNPPTQRTCGQAVFCSKNWKLFFKKSTQL